MEDHQEHEQLSAHEAAANDPNLESVVVEREILNYPSLAPEQQLVTQGSHAENYEHHHQHEHDLFYSENENVATAQQQHVPAAPADLHGVTYQIYPSVYETAIEAAKPSYNIMPYEPSRTDNNDTQNNDAVNALIGEYFGHTTTETKQSQQPLTVQDAGDAHDHSHDHTEHAGSEESPANANKDHQQIGHGFSLQSIQLQKPEHSVQIPGQQNQLFNQLQKPKQNSTQTQLAVTGIQHPTLPSITETNLTQVAATNLISATTRSNIDGIRARQEMNVILKEQKDADDAVKHAEEVLQRAKDNLEAAKRNKILADDRVCTAAEELTDGLLKENTRWNKMYARLVEFKEKEGHCDVLRNPYRGMAKRMKRDKDSFEQNELIALGTWVGQNRNNARRPPDHQDRIEPYKVIALNRIGFDWHPRENYWMEMYEQLKLYLEQNNGKMPPRTINKQKYPLGQWCESQLENYRQFQKGSKKAYITQEKIDMLTAVGFVWDKQGKHWMDNYERLKLFKKKHGHCKATQAVNGGDKPFAVWVNKQRRKYNNFKAGKKDALTEKQAALLDELDFASTHADSAAAASKVVDAVMMM